MNTPSVRYGVKTDTDNAKRDLKRAGFSNSTEDEFISSYRRPKFDDAVSMMRAWQNADMWLGHFEDFRDYLTQGETLEELEENLRDLYKDLTSNEIPGIRSELTVG